MSDLAIIDVSGFPGADEYRAKLAAARLEANRRYGELIDRVLHGADLSGDLANATPSRVRLSPNRRNAPQ